MKKYYVEDLKNYDTLQDSGAIEESIGMKLVVNEDGKLCTTKENFDFLENYGIKLVEFEKRIEEYPNTNNIYLGFQMWLYQKKVTNIIVLDKLIEEWLKMEDDKFAIQIKIWEELGMKSN